MLFKKRAIEKVLLIRPSLKIEHFEHKSLVFPLGLGYIAGVLEKNDYQVKVLDCLAEGFNNEIKKDKYIIYGLSSAKIKRKIEKFLPDVVGISCPFSLQYPFALEVAKITKEVNKEIITILGGAHPSSVPEEVLKDKEIDFVVIGEGEETIINLLSALKENREFNHIDGLGYRIDERIVINPKTRYIQDLDSIPFPAWHLFPMEEYFKVNMPHGIDSRPPSTNMITSRGCPARCIFCSIHSIFGFEYRARSKDNVISEIEFLKKEYSIKEIQFEDDNLTLDKKRAKEIFKGIIEKKLNISWTAPNGIALWALDNELIELMKESGCRHIALGIESGVQEVLDKVIHKPLNLKTVKPLIEKLSEVKIKTTAFFVVGFPQETYSQIKNTLRFALSLPVDDINVYFATPYPNTELYNIAKEKGLFTSDFSFNNLKVSKLNLLNKQLEQKKLERIVAFTVLLFRFKRILNRPAITLIWIRRISKEKKYALRRLFLLIRKIFFH